MGLPLEVLLLVTVMIMMAMSMESVLVGHRRVVGVVMVSSL
jgi:hypothetical protein